MTMRFATPAQLLLQKQRRVRALVIEVSSLILAPVAAVLVAAALGEQANWSRVASAFMFLLVAFGGQAVRWFYYRCAACHKPINRGPRHVPFGQVGVTTCQHCGTRFEC